MDSKYEVYISSVPGSWFPPLLLLFPLFHFLLILHLVFLLFSFLHYPPTRKLYFSYLAFGHDFVSEKFGESGETAPDFWSCEYLDFHAIVVLASSPVMGAESAVGGAASVLSADTVVALF